MWRKRFALLFIFGILAMPKGEPVIVKIVEVVVTNAIEEASWQEQLVAAGLRVANLTAMLNKAINTVGNVTEIVSNVQKANERLHDIKNLILIAQMLDNLSCELRWNINLLKIYHPTSCSFKLLHEFNQVNLNYASDIIKLVTDLTGSISSQGQSEIIHDVISSLETSVNGMHKANLILQDQILGQMLETYNLEIAYNPSHFSKRR